MIEIHLSLKENGKLKSLGRMIREVSADVTERYQSHEVPWRLVKYERDQESITLKYDIDGDMNKG